MQWARHRAVAIWCRQTARRPNTSSAFYISRMGHLLGQLQPLFIRQPLESASTAGASARSEKRACSAGTRSFELAPTGTCFTQPDNNAAMVIEAIFKRLVRMIFVAYAHLRAGAPMAVDSPTRRTPRVKPALRGEAG